MNEICADQLQGKRQRRPFAQLQSRIRGDELQREATARLVCNCAEASQQMSCCKGNADGVAQLLGPYAGTLLLDAGMHRSSLQKLVKSKAKSKTCDYDIITFLCRWEGAAMHIHDEQEAACRPGWQQLQRWSLAFTHIV